MDSYNEREYCEKIERLVSNGNFKDAETLIHKITDLINKQPSYPGYYWRARAYYFLDKNKYADKRTNMIGKCTNLIWNRTNMYKIDTESYKIDIESYKFDMSI